VKKRKDETEEERIAREARNAYYRKWRAEHPDNVKKNQMRYWAKKAKQEQKNGS
jgi:hypothetical protein